MPAQRWRKHPDVCNPKNAQGEPLTLVYKTDALLLHCLVDCTSYCVAAMQHLYVNLTICGMWLMGLKHHHYIPHSLHMNIVHDSNVTSCDCAGLHRCAGQSTGGGR